MIPNDAWDEAVAAVRAARRVALACHVGPDGDALGSLLALGLGLRAMGVAAVGSYGDDPFVIPRQYRFLPGQDLLVPPRDFPLDPEVLVTFDCGSADRLGSLEASAKGAARVVVVDHHAMGAPFGDVRLVEPEAAASAVVVYELLRRLEVSLDADIATCLYTGIVTDTGSFKYRNTTPAIHRIAAELLGFGIEHDVIVREVYDTHPVGFLRIAGAALSRAELVEGASLIWTWIDRGDLERAGVGLDATDGLIDLVRTAETADVACVLKQLDDGRYKVSLRSKGATNVGAIAEAMGGGGHALAAGYTSAATDPRGAIAEVLAGLSGNGAARKG